MQLPKLFGFLFYTVLWIVVSVAIIPQLTFFQLMTTFASKTPGYVVGIKITNETRHSFVILLNFPVVFVTANNVDFF